MLITDLIALSPLGRKRALFLFFFVFKGFFFVRVLF